MLHDFMALSYSPARALIYDGRRGFCAWVDCDGRYERNFCLVRCNAHKRVQALPTMPLYGANAVDAPLKKRERSLKKLNRSFSVIGNSLRVEFLLSQAAVVC
jgi:hypothetical protein